MTENIDQEIPIRVELNEEGTNPLFSYRLNSKEAMLVSQYQYQRKSADFLSRYFFQIFEYRIEREDKLRPKKHFNQQPLNYTQLFASYSGSIFFVLSVT